MPGGEYLTVWDWSPDGKKLAGTFVGAGALAVGYYSFETGAYEKLGEVPSHVQPMWLPDSRRFVFTEGGKAFITDIRTKKTRELLSRPPDLIRNVAVSRDGKYLYFTLQTSQSDIWLLDLT